MTDVTSRPHHPLPADERARHDLLPEPVKKGRGRGADAPEDPEADADQRPRRPYANPDGSPYES